MLADNPHLAFGELVCPSGSGAPSLGSANELQDGRSHWSKTSVRDRQLSEHSGAGGRCRGVNAGDGCLSGGQAPGASICRVSALRVRTGSLRAGPTGFQLLHLDANAAACWPESFMSSSLNIQG